MIFSRTFGSLFFMKELIDHSFRYTSFFLILFVFYANLNGFEKPDSNPLLYAAAIILGSAFLGMVVTGIMKLIRRKG